MNNKTGLALLMAVTVWLAGCTTTTTGSNFEQHKSSTEAAKYNALLGVEYMRMNQLGKAKDKIDSALKADPRVPIAQTAAGMLYDRLGQGDKADKHFKEAIRLNPDDPELLNHYGVFLCRQSRIKEGEQMILKAARDPIYTAPYLAYTNAGLCMNGAGKTKEAEQYFGQALQMRPKFTRALAEMAQLNYVRGEHLDARNYVQRFINAANEARDADPEMPNVLWIGVRVERALNNPGGAEAYGRRLKTEYPKADQTRALQNLERTAG